MADQKQMPVPLHKYLTTQISPDAIPGFTIQNILGDGTTAVTYEVHDKSGIPWALKLVYKESYGDRAPFREVGRFAKARDERFLAFPKETGDWFLKLRNRKYEFIWFKSRCVRGQSLKKFLASNTNFDANIEVLRYIENMTVALEELQFLGFSHGDLHDRNIMREVVGENSALPEIQYVLIDFSEAYPVEETQEGLSKDIEEFGKHLRGFYDAIYRRAVISREDEKLLGAISHIPGLLNGTAPESMAISRPSYVLERFKEGLRANEEVSRKLTDPFHPLSAEYIANEALLTDLCFIDVWWTAKLKENSNVLLIGPRGCGKTMIFKRLRLKTKVAARKTNEIKADPYLGFYIPCESIFYMRFSDLTEVNIEEKKDALILFFNMTMFSEVSSALSRMSDSLGPMSQSITTVMGKLLEEEIGTLWQELSFPSSVVSLDELSTLAESIMRHIRKSLAYGEAIHPRGALDFVTRLVQMLKEQIPSLSNRYFIFFLDDYTEERVPIRLQEILHPIVCQRSSDICFKLSAHMFGSIYNVQRPLALDEGRNIEVINLGTAYLNRNRRRVESKILVKILNDRFKHSAEYQGTINQWLGDTSYPGGRTLSWALHDVKTRNKVKYHGLKCLMDLCTGAYSEMIRLVGDIFREANLGPNSLVQRIDPGIQSRAIEKASREYLSRIRHIRPDGQKLFNIVNCFGELSKNLLYEHPLVGQGKDSRGQVRQDPYDLLNIYVDNLTSTSKAARQVWQRLQKASIFVDTGVATSQRSVIADRATLRRIYCPAFKTTLTSSEHLQLTKDQFEWFMDKPEEFSKHYAENVTGINAPQLAFWGQAGIQQDQVEKEEYFPSEFLPEDKDQVDFVAKAPAEWAKAIDALPELAPLDEVVVENSRFDLYLGAMGFEERTAEAATSLARRGIRVEKAFLFEFDMYHAATTKRREAYERATEQLTSGKPYRPINAPVSVPDPIFSERFGEILKSSTASQPIKILFDVTSCPSLVLSQVLTFLFNSNCDITILYSEAAEYYPTKDEWESGKVKPFGAMVQGPFAGVRFVAKPPVLQADDIGELPILLVLFPTFNTERTAGVLADLEPAERIWLFGEPHDLTRHSFRIDMEKLFAAPNIHPGDKWSLLTTFNYRKTLLALASIYEENRFRYRVVTMPHGSKMQTLGVNLFCTVHQASEVLATPKTYNPDRYSRGCIEVWGLHLGETQSLVDKLRVSRAIGNNEMQ